MPIFEYECPNCQYKEEKLVLKKNEHRPICPKCSQAKMDKIMSISNFHLKGTGWYATDYGQKKKNTGKKSSPKSCKE